MGWINYMNMPILCVCITKYRIVMIKMNLYNSIYSEPELYVV